MILFLFLLGIIIGSFLGVITLRLLANEQFFHGRSHCPQCKRELAWYDLIPLISFLFLKGKCRYCKKPIDIFHIFIELVTGILFAVTGFSLLQQGIFITSLPSLLSLTFALFITAVFIIIFFTDILGGYIFDKVVYPAIGITVLYLLFLFPEHFVSHVVTAFTTFLFFFAIFFLTKGKGMGFGDVKLAFLIGLVLGFPAIIPALYIAFISGAVIGIMVRILQKKKLRGATIPFGPFLVVGAYSAFLVGEMLLTFFPLFQ